MIVNAFESDGSVVFVGSGTLNLTAWSLAASAQPGFLPQIGPANGTLLMGATGRIDSYNNATLSGPSSLGTGGGTWIASHSSGVRFGFSLFGGGVLTVPEGYVSGSLLSGSSHYTGANFDDGVSFAIMGLPLGSHTWSWGSGASADSFTLNVPGSGPVPAPEPGTLSLLGLGLVGLAARRRSAN